MKTDTEGSQGHCKGRTRTQARWGWGWEMLCGGDVAWFEGPVSSGREIQHRGNEIIKKLGGKTRELGQNCWVLQPGRENQAGVAAIPPSQPSSTLNLGILLVGFF